MLGRIDDMTKQELKREQNKRAKRAEMINIYKSLDFNLKQHLIQADSVIRTMTSEMKTFGVPESMYMPYLVERFKELVSEIAESR